MDWIAITAQKMKFSIKDFFSKCGQIRSFLPIWSHLLKNYLIENSISRAVDVIMLKNPDKELKENLIKLEIINAQSEQYSWRNNVELFGILNEISDDLLEQTVTNTCKEYQIDLSFFFLSGLSFTRIHDSQDSRRRRMSSL